MFALKLLILSNLLMYGASLETQIISDSPTSFGDAPYWCALTNSLYYVDFFGEVFSIYRYDYFKNKIYKASILNAPSNAGFIIPIDGSRNEFAVGFADRSVKRICWDGISDKAHILGVIFRVEQDEYYKDNIWHIAKTDPFGRFYGGTMRKVLCTRSIAPDGSVYSYSRRTGPIKQIDAVELSNGIAHSLRRGRMYHIDGCEFVVKAYEWNNVTGEIKNGRKLYQIYDKSDVPTYTGLGVAIDNEDNLYVARYNDSSVVKVDTRTGRELKVFNLPTAYTLDVAFGGPNLNELFVLTGKLQFDLFTATLTDQKLTPSAGYLHIIKKVGATGFAGRPLRLD